MKVEAYKDLSGKLHETKEECDKANFKITIDKIAYSINGDLENEYPDNYSIVSNILSALLKSNYRLSKTLIQDIIDYCEENINYDE